MSNPPPCPECASNDAYEDGSGLLICPACGHEWSAESAARAIDAEDGPRVWRDANGNVLADGDTVTLLKDLPVKGAPKPLKAGTKVKNIKLVDGDHDIDCRIEGFGAMGLKSMYVKKG